MHFAVFPSLHCDLSTYMREHPARPKSRLGLLQEFCCFPLDFACSRPDCSQEPLPTVRRRSVRRSSPPGLWPHYISLCTACLRFYRRHTARWSGQVAIDDVDGSSAHDVLVQNIAAIGHCEQHDGQRTQIMPPAWHSWQSGPKAKEACEVASATLPAIPVMFRPRLAL